VLDLSLAPALAPPGVSWRRLEALDEPALAQLMLEAYRGTLDDHGETLDDAHDEVRRTFSAGHGPLLWEASFVIEADGGSIGLASASVITLWRGCPLLAFSLTRPSARRRGLAGALMGASAHALALQGHGRLALVVTRGNTPAERLYEKLGFREPEPPV
jgi:GNAT superfamily N-acetyltransferase